MTDEQALEQARARWGPRAVVHSERLALADGTEVVRCSVGRLGHDAFSWCVYGQGASWALAFNDADLTAATIDPVRYARRPRSAALNANATR